MVPPSGDEKRWIWRPEYFRAFANADIELIKNVFYLVYLDIVNIYGSPLGIGFWKKMG